MEPRRKQHRKLSCSKKKADYIMKILLAFLSIYFGSFLLVGLIIGATIAVVNIRRYLNGYKF
jgi:hypothetical protein